MPASPVAAAAVAALRRRLVVAGFVDGLMRALFAASALAAVAVLGGRSLSLPVAPTMAWWWGLVPVFGFAAWNAWRRPLSPASLAAHLDRRLSLHGLLVSAHEGAALDAAFAERLSQGLAEVATAMPSLQWRRILWRPLVAAGLAAFVFALPALEIDPLPTPVAATEALQKLEQQFQGLQQDHRLGPDVEQEMMRQLQEVAGMLAKGDPDAWRALDEAQKVLSREGAAAPANAPLSTSAAATLAKVAQDLAARVPLADVTRAAELLRAAGGIDDLGKAAKQMLDQAASPDGTFDPGRLPVDPTQLAELARAVADTGLLRDAAKMLGTLSPAQMGELMQMAKGFARAVGAFDRGRELAQALLGRGVTEPGSQPAGRHGSTRTDGGDTSGGGPSRGPGRASLAMSEAVRGDAAAPMPLPPGQAQPDEWRAQDIRRSEPEVRPERNRGNGGQGVAGAGGETWQLRVLPRHRGVVQRFFDGGKAAGGK